MLLNNEAKFWRQLREKYSHSGLVWPALRHFLSEYGDVPFKSPYSAQMREKNSHQKKAPSTDTFYTVVRFCGS